MRHSIAAFVAAAALAALLEGCVSGGAAAGSTPAPSGTPAEQAALARYTAYAGPPLPSFTWLGHFYSWESLGKDQLVVFTLPNEAYLLKVWPPCDLRFVIDAIGITSTAHTVYAHADSITVNAAGTGPGRWHCPIDEIRRIDYPRMRAELRAAGPASQQTPPPQ